MKRNSFLFLTLIFCLTSILAAGACLVGNAKAADAKVYKMVGKITAIDLDYNTVVIEVPLGKKETFTVGGPLAKDAIIEKKGVKNPSLKDFKVGDEVVVKWEPTPNGHLIKMLAAK